MPEACSERSSFEIGSLHVPGPLANPAMTEIAGPTGTSSLAGLQSQILEPLMKHGPISLGVKNERVCTW